MTLTYSSDVSTARWLTAGDDAWEQLVFFGPAGFPAYARLRFIPDPAHPGQTENDVDINEDHPSESSQLRLVLNTLARHTRTHEDCYFCLWDGWGSDLYGDDVAPSAQAQRGGDGLPQPMAPAFPVSVLSGPKVEIPHRAYFLFRGRVSDDDWGAADMWPGQPRTEMPSPAFIWPADHAWCIANDVDPHWAGIGGSTRAIDELIADPRVDVVSADRSEDQPHYW